MPEGDSVLPRCRRLADFLIARQKVSGFIPTGFDEAGQVEEGTSTTVSAETAPVARFFFELSKVDKRRKYRDAALKALDFLDRSISPRKWFDFETFWS